MNLPLTLISESKAPVALPLPSGKLRDHLGNVTAVVSDGKLPVGYALSPGDVDYFVARVVSARDFYPFGMGMPGRRFEIGEYRYGFNGQEFDSEWLGEGNAVSFKYRVHDARLGRFLSVDPLASDYPWNSTYAFAENDVVRAIDLEGAEKLVTTNLEHKFMSEIAPNGAVWEKLEDDRVLTYRKTVNYDEFTGTKYSTVEVIGEQEVVSIVENWEGEYWSGNGQNSLYGEMWAFRHRHFETTRPFEKGLETFGKEIGAIAFNVNPLSLVPTSINGGEGPMPETEFGNGVMWAAIIVTPGSAGKAVWPWKTGSASIKALTAGGGNCMLHAQKILQSFATAGISGRIMKMVPKYPMAKFIGPFTNRSGRIISTEFQDHFAVRVGEMVYDRITGPEGMHIDEYKKLFEWADDLLFNNFL